LHSSMYIFIFFLLAQFNSTFLCTVQVQLFIVFVCKVQCAFFCLHSSVHAHRKFFLFAQFSVFCFCLHSSVQSFSWQFFFCVCRVRLTPSLAFYGARSFIWFFDVAEELILFVSRLRPCSLPIPTQNISSSTYHIKSFDACMEH
jgi:hypothetical protein